MIDSTLTPGGLHEGSTHDTSFIPAHPDPDLIKQNQKQQKHIDIPFHLQDSDVLSSSDSSHGIRNVQNLILNYMLQQKQSLVLLTFSVSESLVYASFGKLNLKFEHKIM